MAKFKKGDIVKYSSAFCSPGEEKYVSVVVEVRDHSDDRDLHRVDYVISVLNTSLALGSQEVVSEEMIVPLAETLQPEVFYTGGGIWLSASYITDKEYFVVEGWEGYEHNEDPETCLTYYIHDDNEDGDFSEYPCQNMIWSKELSELNEQELAIWTVLHDALVQTMDNAF